MKLLFSYIAQPHQILHSLPIAMEISRKYLDMDVHIICLDSKTIEYIKTLHKLYPNTTIHYHLFHIPAWLQSYINRYGNNALSKIILLFWNKNFFNQFDAIIVPERTSLFLKKMGVHKPKIIWTRHGAGDRAIGFAKDVSQFDFILMAGKKIEQRLLQQQSIRLGRYQSGVYAKLDLVHKIHPDQISLFDNDKPTILYNPHFKAHLSSWHLLGHQILQQFAEQDRYNLIFAPHYRLFYPQKQKQLKQFEIYEKFPHILLDLGSHRSVDMTYTIAADLYLGDVSSQLSEFLINPRPCVFLNAHDIKWKEDVNYISWRLGQVISTSRHIIKIIDNAFILQKNFLSLQKKYISNTFGTLNGPTAHIGADAIINYLRD